MTRSQKINIRVFRNGHEVANVVNVGIKDFHRNKKITPSGAQLDDYWFKELALSLLSWPDKRYLGIFKLTFFMHHSTFGPLIIQLESIEYDYVRIFKSQAYKKCQVSWVVRLKISLLHREPNLVNPGKWQKWITR